MNETLKNAINAIIESEEDYKINERSSGYVISIAQSGGERLLSAMHEYSGHAVCSVVLKDEKQAFKAMVKLVEKILPEDNACDIAEDFFIHLAEL